MIRGEMTSPPERSVPVLRLATPDDADAIETVMKSSTRELFPSVYDARQTASSIEHIAIVDRMLIEDRTYFVIEEDGTLLACGGWSRRDRLYTGSRPGSMDARLLDPATEPARVRAMFVRPDRTRLGFGTRILAACEQAARAEGFRSLTLLSTLPGVPLYERCGFAIAGPALIALADGTTLAGATMTKSIAR